MSVAYCISESVYCGRLSHGKQYEILEEGDNNNIRIVGDNGKRRWFPWYCFSRIVDDVIVAVNIEIEDHIDVVSHARIDVTLELSNGQRRWCFFETPTSLNDLSQAGVAGERLIMYGAPNMIVVSAINNDVIEQIIQYLERQNELLKCTSLIIRNPDE